MEIGDRVKLKESATVGDWVREQVNGKVGTIIAVEHPDGVFDWVVHFDDVTGRLGGNFAFFEDTLESAK